MTNNFSRSVAKKVVVLELEVRSQPTNPTCQVGSVFRGWWVGLGYEFFFNSRCGGERLRSTYLHMY